MKIKQIRPNTVWFTPVGLLLACILGSVHAASMDDFFGSYSGAAQYEQDGQQYERDLSVKISGDSKSFELTWKSVTHRPDGNTKTKEYTVPFISTQRTGIYSSAMRRDLFGGQVALDPLKGDPFVWARITGDIFTVYSLLVLDDGGYEMQVYNRTLQGKDLKLDFDRFRNGERLKTIKAILVRQ